MFINSIGIDNFRELREENRTYLDKTNCISTLVSPGYPKVSLITRPRRFGKSLTINMLSEFFDINKNSSDIFDGLEISKNKDICKEWMNQYPVINISLKEMSTDTFEKSIETFSEIVEEILIHNQYLFDSKKVYQEDKNILKKIDNREASEVDLRGSLKRICRSFQAYWGKQAIVFIDEYDASLNYAYQNGYYRKMVDFIRGLFSGTLKGNPHLKFAVITGCLRIAKESIFTGVNNFRCYSISDIKYADTFGFTEQDVDYLLSQIGLTNKKEEIRDWYDGYRFGKNSDIYCPWDVLNYLENLSDDKDAKPESFWVNSSGNDIIKKFLDQKQFSVKGKIESLLNNGYVKTNLTENLTFDTIYQSEINFWNVLYATGYLTKAKLEDIVAPVQLEYNEVLLRIPNKEIFSIFTTEVLKWFNECMSKKDQTPLFNAFWNGDNEALTNLLSDILLTTISYHDYYENFYHAFLIGLFSSQGYEVSSNIESGIGRSDILIRDLDNHQAACIEVKRTDERIELEEKAKEALRQIVKNKYDTQIRSFKNIKLWGIAFYKKTCIARSLSELYS